MVRNELELYNKDLPDSLRESKRAGIMGKSEVIVLTKVDILTEEEQERKLRILKKITEHVFPISILDDKLVKEFGNALAKNLSYE